jgi:hypothetical protein
MIKDPSRVKGRDSHNNLANARDCLTAEAEQPMNIAAFDGDLAALLPQGDLA